MNVTYYQLAILGNVRTLENLTHLLDRGEEYARANKIEEAALLDARLFPDMFPFARQVRMVCDMSRLAVAWLTGKDAPKYADDEKSFTELKTRVAHSITWLKTFTEADFSGSATREVRLPWSPDKAYRGEVFLLQHAVPNIYFHLTTAYDLLRHNGVPIGKADYLGKIG